MFTIQQNFEDHLQDTQPKKKQPQRKKTRPAIYTCLIQEQVT